MKTVKAMLFLSPVSHGYSKSAGYGVAFSGSQNVLRVDVPGAGATKTAKQTVLSLWCFYYYAMMHRHIKQLVTSKLSIIDHNYLNTTVKSAAKKEVQRRSTDLLWEAGQAGC